MTTTLRSLAAAIILAAATPAFATGQDSISATVRIRDLDLASRRGQAMLDRRIDRAAHIVCDTANDRFGGSVRASQRACRREVAASVRDQVTHRAQDTMLAAR